jgi:hypothetical protein
LDAAWFKHQTLKQKPPLSFFFFDINSYLAAVPVDFLDYAENWPEPVQRHLQPLMGDHLISACTDTQFQ